MTNRGKSATNGSTRAKFRLYSGADLGGRRGGLIKAPRDEDPQNKIARQKELVRAAEDSAEAFLNWFQGIAIDGESLDLPFRSKEFPMTEQEVVDPPFEVEKERFELLQCVQPKSAAMPSFWASYHLKMVEMGVIDPAALAANPNSPRESGRARMQKVLRRSSAKQLDRCTRTILRQLGGLPEERGKVSVFVDCRMARSWWRGYISHQVSEDMGLAVEDVWRHLRMPDATWEQLQQYSVMRLTVLADRNVRSPLVARLMEGNIDKWERKKRRLRIQDFFSRVGMRCAYQALGALPPEQNLEVFREMRL